MRRSWLFALALVALLLGALLPRNSQAFTITQGGLPIIGTGATYTTSTPLINLSETWNAGGVAFNLIQGTVTDTASANGSTIMDWKVGANSVMRIEKDATAGAWIIKVPGGVTGTFFGGLGFTGTDSASGTLQLELSQDGANSNTLAINPIVEKAGITLYGVAQTNFERMSIGGANAIGAPVNTFIVSTQASGTGVVRPIQVGPNSQNVAGAGAKMSIFGGAGNASVGGNFEASSGAGSGANVGGDMKFTCGVSGNAATAGQAMRFYNSLAGSGTVSTELWDLTATGTWQGGNAASSLTWSAGLGAMTLGGHLVGPTDNTLTIKGGASVGPAQVGNGIALTCTNGAAGGAGTSFAGGAFTFTAGSSAATGAAQVAGGAFTFTAGSAASGGGGAAADGGGYTFTTGAGAGGGFNGSTLVTSAQGDRLDVVGKRKVLSNTSATTTTFCQIGLATAGTGCGGTIHYSVIADDGTNVNTASGYYSFSASNKTGTVTATSSSTVEVTNANSGTLTDASAVTITGTNVNLRITPVFTVIVPTTVTIEYTIVLQGRGTISPQ